MDGVNVRVDQPKAQNVGEWWLICSVWVSRTAPRVRRRMKPARVQGSALPWWARPAFLLQCPTRDRASYPRQWKADWICLLCFKLFWGGGSFREGTLQWWGMDMEIERWAGLGCMMWNSQSINKVLCHLKKKVFSLKSFVYLKSLTFDSNDLSHFYTKASCIVRQVP